MTDELTWQDVAVQRGVELGKAHEIIKSLLALDELELGDESILAEDEPDHPVVRANEWLGNNRTVTTKQ